MADKRDNWFGLHEQLDTPAPREKLVGLGLDDLAVWQKVDADELPAAVTAHLARALAAGLDWTSLVADFCEEIECRKSIWS